MYQVQPPRDTASLLDGFAHQTKDTGGFPSFGGIPLREFFPQHVAEIGDAAQLLAKAIVQFLREATPLTLAQFEQFKFKLLAPGDVADKPAGMDESPVFPQRIGVRQHMARGSVVGEKFGRNIVQRLAFGQLREHSRDRGRLRVKLAQGAADHLFGRPIQQVEEGAIGAKDRSIARGQDNAHGRFIEQILQLVLPAREHINHPAFARDVARDGGKSSQSPPRVAHGRERQRNVDALPVFAQPFRVVVLHDFAAPDSGEELAELVALSARQQHATGAPDNLRSLKTEDALRGRVPIRDDTTKGTTENGVVGMLDDGGKLTAHVR